MGETVARLEPGTLVEWASSSNGTRKAKRGRVVAFVPGHRNYGRHAGNAYAAIPAGAPPGRARFGGNYSTHDRYVVAVPADSDKPTYYAPVARWVTPVAEG